MTWPAPVQRVLVPDVAPAVPDGFTLIDEPLRAGLPHRIALSPALSVVVAMPTGVIGAWRDADADALVSSSDAQLSPMDPVDVPPPRLIVQAGSATLGAVAPVAGLRLRIGAPRVELELMALGWVIHAGTVRGAGDHGSRVQLAWRALGGGR